MESERNDVVEGDLGGVEPAVTGPARAAGTVGRPGSDELVHDRPLVAEDDLRVTSVHAEVLTRDIAGILTRQVADGDCFVILEVCPDAPVDSSRYVQTLALPDGGLLAECAGERYVRYSPDELQEIARLGWFPPTGQSMESAGNFTAHWEEPDVLDAAQLLALTLIRVHGLDRPEHLGINVGESWAGD